MSSKLDSRSAEPLPRASLLVRCVALAVDIFMALAVASAGFALVALVVPADSAGAKFPIFIITIAAFVYLAVWRMRWLSAGRYLFKLRATRLDGPAGMPGKTLTVHTRVIAPLRPIALAVALSAFACILSVAALSQVLISTKVFQRVVRHTSEATPLSADYGAVPFLSPLPSALLIGDRRAYVRIGATWGARSGVLEFFLRRERRGWRVVAVHESRKRQFLRYALAIAEVDIPTPGEQE
ncbi:MAG: hypothetical protein GKR94_20860 [Gammaproteobacteria bacterium]|nr:hypothetical protein [Gammaproteobacteria bacterium]